MTASTEVASERTDSIRSFPRPECPVCGGNGENLYRHLRDGVFGAPGEWAMRRCVAKACGVLWLDPRPALEDLQVAYRNYYTHQDPSETSRGALKKMYRVFSGSLLSVSGVLAERRRMDGMFIERDAPGSLLDIGCGQGVFLSRMAKRGWTVAGVDFDPDAVNLAQTLYGVDARVAGIDDIPYSPGSFDVITASHVIEHMADPLEFFVRCYRLLKVGGRLILRTPNARSAGHRKYRSAWRGLEPPRHLCVLTGEAVRDLAVRAGFKVVDCSTSHAMTESIHVVSHFLRKYGTFKPDEIGFFELLACRVWGPMAAVRARIASMFDNSGGEELYAVLRRDESRATD